MVVRVIMEGDLILMFLMLIFLIRNSKGIRKLKGDWELLVHISLILMLISSNSNNSK